MENLHNFDENKLKKKNKMFRFLFCVITCVFVIVFLLAFCNFTDKYGKIPAIETLSSQDKFFYVLLNEGKPIEIQYNYNQVTNSEIYLLYNKNIYSIKTDVKMFFTSGRLRTLVYDFDEESINNAQVFFENIISNIENELDERFIAEIDMLNCKAEWKYSEGARSESIEFYIENNKASIIVMFQY